MQRIDITTAPPSAAAQLYAEIGAQMEEDATHARQIAEDEVRSKTKAQVADAIADLDPGTRLLPAAKREVLVSAYVEARLATDEIASNLARIKADMRGEERAVERLNEFMDRADDADTVLRQLAAQNDGPAMLRSVAWRLDELFLAQALSYYASRVRRLIDNGKDVRTAILDVIADAMRTLMDFPGFVRASGVGSVARAETLAETRAARDFITTMVDALRLESIPCHFMK